MKKKFFGLLLAATLCVACAACGGDNQTDNNPTEAPEATATPTPEPVVDNGTSNTMTEDMISITVSTNKTSYEAGEKVYYTIQITNNHELYVVNKSTIEYKNTAGLKAANSVSMPTELPQVFFGESYEIHGELIGNESTFPVTGEVPADVAPEYNADPYNGTKTTEKISVVKTNKNVTLRPFVEFMYGGQKVMVRAIVELSLGMEKGKFGLSEYVGAKRTTCHDPSIFKDVDGTYYIYGTHMTMSTTPDLLNWTNKDAAWKNAFDKETRDKIK